MKKKSDSIDNKETEQQAPKIQASKSAAITTSKRKNEWIEYDWEFEGNDSLTGTFIFSPEDLKQMGEYLITVTFTSRSRELKRHEVMRFEREKDRLLREQGTLIYLGFIEILNKVSYYFYALGHDSLGFTEYVLKRVKNVACECRPDENHSFYMKLLYPTQAKLQTEENRKQLEIYEKKNDNMSAPRKVSLRMYFASEPVRIMFCEQARLAGFAVGEAEFTMEYELPHGVAINKITSLSKKEIDEITTSAINIAEKFGGVLMFWDSLTVLRRK